MRSAVICCVCLLPFLAAARPQTKDPAHPFDPDVKTPDVDNSSKLPPAQNPYSKEFIAALRRKITTEYERQSNIVDESQNANPYEPEIKIPKQKKVFDILEEVNKDLDPQTVIEGDILTIESHHVIKRRGAISETTGIWPDGILPYEFHSSFNGADDRSIVRRTMASITAKTCVTFVEIDPNSTPPPHRVSITAATFGSCSSYVGKVNRFPQPLNLGHPLCVNTGVVGHELMHAIGFYHEQSRPDRDSYVRINDANIRSGTERNFRRQADARKLHGYDLGSVMHYSSTAFSINGLNTIEALNGNNDAMGQRTSLAATDIAGINELYGCNDISTNGQWGLWEEYSTCTTTCGNGVRTRARLCNFPSPMNGGHICRGLDRQTETCDMGSCIGSIHDVRCNFDSGSLCGWTSSIGEDDNRFMWTRKQGSTQSGSTGPSTDHTSYGYGTYLYVESSYPAQQFQYALLRSPVLASKGTGQQRCLTFWIHRQGLGMGKTQVLLRNSNTNNEIEIATINGNHQDDQWYFHQFNFDASYSAQVIFKGERGLTWQSDMALDDININYEPCDVHSCDFEGSICDWTIHGNENYLIQTRSGRTPSYYTGPESAATGDGYVYAEASYPAQSGHTSYLTSPVFQSGVERCMRFSTHMYGYYMGQLYVRRVPTSDVAPGSGITTIAQFNDTQNAWVSHSFTISSDEGSGSFKIQFQFVRGSSWSSDIAVDSVRFTDGACAIP